MFLPRSVSPYPQVSIMAQVPSGDVCSFHPDESIKSTSESGFSPHTHDHGPGSHSHDHSHDPSTGPFTLAEHGHTHEHLDHAGRSSSCSIQIASPLGIILGTLSSRVTLREIFIGPRTLEGTRCVKDEAVPMSPDWIRHGLFAYLLAAFTCIFNLVVFSFA